MHHAFEYIDALRMSEFSVVDANQFSSDSSRVPKNAIIPQLAVHPNRQLAVLLIVLTFRLFFWGIVPGEFICCDPRSCVVGANIRYKHVHVPLDTF